MPKLITQGYCYLNLTLSWELPEVDPNAFTSHFDKGSKQNGFKETSNMNEINKKTPKVNTDMFLYVLKKLQK